MRIILILLLAVIASTHAQLWFFVNGVTGNDGTAQPGNPELPYKTIQGAIATGAFLNLPLISINALQPAPEDSFVFPPFDIIGRNVYVLGTGSAFIAPFIDSAPTGINGVIVEGATIILSGGSPVSSGVGNITCTKCNWQSISTPFILDNIWFTIDKNTFLWTGVFDTFFEISGPASAVELIQSPITLYANMFPIGDTITFFEVSNQGNLLTERVTVGVEFGYTPTTKFVVARSINARQNRHYDFTLAYNEAGANIKQVTWAQGSNSVIEFYGAKGLGSGTNTVEIYNDMSGNSKVISYDFQTDNYIQIRRDSSLGYYDITDLSGVKTSAGLEVNARLVFLCGNETILLDDQFLILELCKFGKQPSLILPNFESTSRGKRVDIKNESGLRVKLIGNLDCNNCHYLSAPSATLYFVDGVWYVL